MFEHTRAGWNQYQQKHVLESLLLHSRNLREFLFGRIEDYGRDIDKALLGTDYAPQWNSDKGNHNYRILWDTEKAIDAQLAHLSRRRADIVSQRKLDQEAEAIAAAIARAWGLFRQALLGTPWSAFLDSAITQKRSELGLSTRPSCASP